MFNDDDVRSRMVCETFLSYGFIKIIVETRFNNCIDNTFVTNILDSDLSDHLALKIILNVNRVVITDQVIRQLRPIT